METLRELGQQVYVEVGAGTTLVGLGRQSQESGSEKESGKAERLWAVTLRKGRGEWEQVLESLGRLYERGAEVEWEGFDRGTGRRRVALPTYPFQRQRYWVENTVRQPGQFAARAEKQNKVASGGVPDDWYYEIAWEAKPLPAASRQATSSNPGHWLIVPDSRGVAAELANQLKARGESVSMATSLESTSELPRTGSYDFVLHMASLDCPDPGTLDSDQLWASESALMSNILATTQAMMAMHKAARLWLITAGAEQVVAGQSALNVIQAPVWGLGRGIALEHAANWGGLIDLDPGANPQESAAQLLASILHGDGEDQSAVRDGVRYVVRLKSRTPLSSPQPAFQAEKIYLITGGLGGLGLKVAKWMVERGARRLVLAGRSGLPDRSIWDGLPAESTAGKKVTAIRAMEKLGAQVRVEAMDICDPQQVAALFATFGPGELKGI